MKQVKVQYIIGRDLDGDIIITHYLELYNTNNNPQYINS